MAALFEPKKNNSIAILQKSIEEKDGRIRFLYDEIGKLYFRQYRDMNADVSREINTRCEFITNLYIDIENCRLRILYEKGYKECKNCKRPNLLEHAYCCACGSKFPDSNDVNIVTAVDPEKFVIKIPEVTMIPMAETSAPAGAEAPVATAAAPVAQTVAPAEAAVAETVPVAAPVEAASAPVEAPAPVAPVEVVTGEVISADVVPAEVASARAVEETEAAAE